MRTRGSSVPRVNGSECHMDDSGSFRRKISGTEAKMDTMRKEER